MQTVQEKNILLRIIRFSVVGASGVIVNMGFLALFKGIFHLPLWFAGLIAIEISILSNFALNDLWTWRDRRGRKFFDRIWRYHVSVGITAYGFNYPILLLFTQVLSIPYLWANLIGIVIASAANFVLNHFWTYKKNKAI